MGRAELIRGDPWHIDPIAEKMREADAIEVWAAARMSPLEALEMSFNSSMECWTIAADEGPVAMGGVVSPRVVWLLGTDWITNHGIEFTKLVKPKIAELVRTYCGLFNYVHDDNEVAKGWLKMMGFKLEDPRPYGVHAALFCHFSKQG